MDAPLLRLVFAICSELPAVRANELLGNAPVWRLSGNAGEAVIGAAFPKPVGCNLGVVAKTLLARPQLFFRPAAVGDIYQRPHDADPAAVLDPAAMYFNRKGRTVFAQ